MQLFALAMVICLSQPIYYKDFSYSNGRVILGKTDGDLEVFNQSGSVKAIIELVK